MKHSIAALLLTFLLLAPLFSVSAETPPALSFEEIVDLAIAELTADEVWGKTPSLQNGNAYRTFIHRWQNPENESVNGETWYVRFEAADRVNDNSYIIALNEDGELRYLDLLPSEVSRQSLGTISFIDMLDRYRERFGAMDTWNSAAFMSFAAELSKGKPDGRNTWRFQHAVFIPVPENAISKADAQAIAAESIHFPKETAVTCTCLWDGDKPIYKIAFSHGHGWEYMVDLDCITGEILYQIPFDASIHSWVDCYIPSSLLEHIPPQEVFLPANG